MKHPTFKSILVIILSFLSYVDFHLIKTMYLGSFKNEFDEFVKIYVSFFNLGRVRNSHLLAQNIEKVMFSIKMHYEEDIWTLGMYICIPNGRLVHEAGK